jgi:uncharacterized damage-inducible protein DinB
MTMLAMLRMMAVYHGRANLALLAATPAPAATAPCGALYFGTIHASLNHIAAVDDLWLKRATAGGTDAYNHIYANDAAVTGVSDCDLWTATCPDMDATAELLRLNGAAVKEYLATATAEQLDGMCEYENTDGGVSAAPRGPALMHLFNHATHHRGQCHAALTAQGHTPPILDMPFVMGSALNLDRYR